ncbi:DUF434 domain-containing protein [Clostridium senegalense]|uniref:DUF434 domain-containing protein n=1 Tax=Clostridium senegalense TaxID=1465809 RepID=UPI001C101442|nr:DUF434 domain-containing protein [Clostridium senegalense]MBU5226290.1 DUF434 domain-containing protein [Clostridium senegalense]
MSKSVRRGYVLKDEEEFSKKSINKLYKAGEDLRYLLNRSYNIKGSSTFIGNHYLLSERQRLSIVRGISSDKSVENRKAKEIPINKLENETVNIDGFNTVITLEVALSNSVILNCMDGTIRDLAGLRGTYKIIDKSELAIKLIGNILEKYKIKEAIFYLDSPVSNSGRLKLKILELLKDYNFQVEAKTINNVDTVLESSDCVITSDAIILDKCNSWINLNKEIIKNNMLNTMYVDFETNLKNNHIL